MAVPSARLLALNDAPVRPAGRHVLYWMVATRRSTWNFGLDRALEQAAALKRPLLVLEALRVGFRWDSDRVHRFVLQGMADNAAAFAGSRVGYHPYVEVRPGDGRGLLETLAADACLVVTDDWPCFFLPRMQRAVAARLPVRVEAVDSVGLLPFRSVDRAFARAVDFRRNLQKVLPDHLSDLPAAAPLADLDLPPCPPLPAAVLARWPRATAERLAGRVDDLDVDHDVAAVGLHGGAVEAGARWQRFLDRRLPAYADGRNHPDEDVASGLSPWLHFGHLSVHRMWADIAASGGWQPGSRKATGSREGWWGLSPAAEGFLDELVTWRELSLNGAAWLPAYDRYEGTPDWARRTLAEHAGDPRPILYSLDQLDRAQTHDPIWNAAQTQLRESGVMHNYLRMLWGKKVLEWSKTPQLAFDTLVELNNRYALDGRDPNSYSGIGWVFGRYDRAWGPERPIFGKVRYMSSDNTVRKLRMQRYLEQWG